MPQLLQHHGASCYELHFWPPACFLTGGWTTSTALLSSQASHRRSLAQAALNILIVFMLSHKPMEESWDPGENPELNHFRPQALIFIRSSGL